MAHDLERPTHRDHGDSVGEIVQELQDHCALFHDMLIDLYEAHGPVVLPDARRRHLRTLVHEFQRLLDHLQQLCSVPPTGVVTQPSRERNVPAAPELGDRPAEVGLLEVVHQLDPKQTCRAAGQIAVA